MYYRSCKSNDKAENTSVKHTALPGFKCFIIIALLVVTLASLHSQALAVRSALARAGDTVAVPVEITGSVKQIYGFQMDLSIVAAPGAPDLIIREIIRGEAVNTGSALDYNVLSPVPVQTVRIGLPNALPVTGSARPHFSGPGVLAWLILTVPAGATTGQSYQLNLQEVYLAGPGNLALPVSVFCGVITVAGSTVLADTITFPQTFTVAEGTTAPLTVTVTGGGMPVPGIVLQWSIDDPAKALPASSTAVTDADGNAAVHITGKRGGTTIIRINAPGLVESCVNLTVQGVSPQVTSLAPLEVPAGAVYTYDVEAVDPNGDPLTFALQEAPAGMTIDPDTGIITWEPPAGWPQGGNAVIVVVSDPGGHTDTQQFSIFIVVDADHDGFDNRADCNDFNPAVFPGAPEVCNGIDDNCNGLADEGVQLSFYLDADQDGYGNPAVSLQACTVPAGFAANYADCSDNDPGVNPAAHETGDNGVDEDCNPATPDNWSRSFVAAVSDNGSVYYAKSNGDGTFGNYRLLADIGDYSARAITINDFNNDGYLDLIAGGGVSGRVDYFFFINDGADNFHNLGIVLSSAVTGSTAMDLASGDVNNDGYMDFLAGADSEQVLIALGNGRGEFTATISSLGGRSRGMDAADFNNDGLPDFARTRYSDGYLYVYTGKGDGTFNAGVLAGDPGSDPYGVAAADFDNDGQVDIIANEGSSGDPYFFKGLGNGTFTALGYLASADANNHGSFDAYDLNNDGNADLVLSDYSGYRLYFYPGNGNGTFGSRVQISPSNTSGYVLAIAAPPYRTPGTPFAVIRPQHQTIAAGGTAQFAAAGSHDEGAGTIVSWNWDFGDGTTGTGMDAGHTYLTEGTYNATLKITDDDGKTEIAAVKVYVQGALPAADTGGPYTYGEVYANNGLYTVTLDGSGSTDDSGIVLYEWSFGDAFKDLFDGITLDADLWIAGAGVTQDDKATIVGAGAWGSRYLVSRQNFFREAGLVFEARVRPVNTTGNQSGMFGFKNTTSNNSYNQMPHAFYFNQGGLYVYEDGSSRGQFGTYTRSQEYEIKIVLKAGGASYYLRIAGAAYWDLIYDSAYSAISSLKAGADINSGTFTMDDARVYIVGRGQQLTRLLAAGTYPVILTVTDTAGLQDTAASVINIVANDPPGANPGGPYTAAENDAVGGQWFIPLNGSLSTDDYGIARYDWDFNNADGIQSESTAANPTWIYKTPGTYTVTLTVTDHALQTHSAVTQVIITTPGIAPAANPGGPYMINEESAAGGVWTILLDGSGSTDDLGISRYEWQFGDGDTATTYYGGERINGFAAGTDLYGYDIADAGLRIIAAENNTRVRIINLATGAVVNSATLSRYQSWWNAAPGDGIYFKVESDKPVLAYQSDFSGHTAFVPALESGPVGRNFTVYYYTSAGYSVFAYEDTVVTFYTTAGALAAQRIMPAGTYWNPGLTSNTVYRVYATGRISMQNDAGNSYTTVPADNGGTVGRLFYASVNGATTTGAMSVFAYEDAVVTVTDMDTAALLDTHTVYSGENWFRTGLGTRRIRVESTGDIELWAGDTQGGTAPSDLGDDTSFTAGRQGQEFYLNTLRDGAVIFAPYPGTAVSAGGAARVLEKDQYWHLAGGGAAMHITASRPVVIQTLGRANAFDDAGTFLGGRSAIRHYYNAAGTYNLALTVYDNAGASHSRTTTVTVGVSQPPVADTGGPYVLNESNAAGGTWNVNLDASGSTDDYGIYKYEWDFDASNGIQVNGTTAVSTAAYTKPGIYTVTLRVYDQALQATQAVTTVTVLANSPPVANAGGPYVCGEEAASYGIRTAKLNGSASYDDFAVYRYQWVLNLATAAFTGTVIDTAAWNVSSDVTQNNGLLFTGAGAWGSRYAGSVKDYPRETGFAYQARVLPVNTSGNQNGMFGFKNTNSDYNYNQLMYAVYFNNGTLMVYENGSSRGNLGTYTRNIPYDIRIVLKAAGARYYYKQASADTWTLLYDSPNFTTLLLKTAATINAGNFLLESVSLLACSNSINPEFELAAPGIYPAALTVTDHALQEDTDPTNITVTDGLAPVAEAGGPYTAETGHPAAFNGTGSTDDNAIEKYEWTFGDTTGAPLELPFTGKGATPEHIYRTPGTYTATLFVTDHTLKTSTDTATVTVGSGTAPIAHAGGPYACGAGGPPAYFDAGSSFDDFGIVEYRWDTDSNIDRDGDGNPTNDIDVTGRNPFYTYTAVTGTYLNDAFQGTSIDATRWLTGGAVQNEKITLTGTGAWGSRYLFSAGNFRRGSSVTYRGQVLPVNLTGGQNLMWGFKDTGTNYNYSQMPHSIYFNNGAVYVYEKSNNRGQFGTYTRGVLYDVQIVLKASGAVYYYKQSAAPDWIKLYESTTAITDSPLKIGATVAGGTFELDNVTAGAPEHYTVTLTVEDGSGRTGTATALVTVRSENLPPQAITVPWVAHDPSVPHEAINGKAVTLKGIVRDGDAAAYQWDFGDGTRSPVQAITDPYNLAATHTYPGVVPGTPFTAVLTVWDSAGQSGSDPYNVIVKNKSLSVETNIAIDDGLWYLHVQQTRTTAGNYPAGWWRTFTGGTYYSSATAAALQAFEINGHLETGNHRENPYVETVDRGFKFLFTAVSAYSINNQTYGNPDSNGNGLGIGVNEGQPIYQGGPVMDAIASSRNPLARTVTGGANVVRRSYYDILTDMSDMFAWGQDDNATAGGWRYNWNEWPDNSAAQWGAIGLQAAEDIFGIPIPQWVKERNNVWLNTSYDGTGFGYTGAGNGRATTPSGMVQLAFDDKTTADTRWKTAENYIASRWGVSDSECAIYRWIDGNGENTRDYYAMYALTKAMRLANPKPVTKFRSNGFDWYNDPQAGMARSVIDDQLPDGRISGIHRTNNHLRTAWGVIILSQTLFVQPPVADAGRNRVWGVNVPLTFDGSGSYHLDPFRGIVKYEWDFNGDGVYDSVSSSPLAVYTYTGDPSTLPRNYVVTLRVTDNNAPQLTDTDSVVVVIAVPPHPPAAVPGGPYSGTAGLPVTLDGSASFDIDPTDFVSAYAWELDNVFPYNFADAAGAHPVYTWALPGTYNVGLRVLDNGVMNDLDADGIIDDNERLEDQQFTTIVIAENQPPRAVAGGPYGTDEGGTVLFDAGGSSDPNGDPLFYSWDLDNDGEYDDATGVTVMHPYMENGAYTVGLRVTDTLLADTDPALVTVNDLAPHAAFTWAPAVQTEGAVVTFTDQSSSYPDSLAAWDWDFAGLESSAGQHPAFTFNDNGTYPVSLAVTDTDGSVNTRTEPVTILNAAPVVDAGAAQTVFAGFPVNFNGSFTDPGSLDTHTILWDFGDGNTAAGTLVPVHTYALPGSYTARLTVTDDDGGTGSGTLAVTVNRLNQPPVAVAGDDRNVEAYADTGATVVLDGTGSYDPDGDALTYLWSGAFGTAAGSAPVVTLPVGTHTVTLTVSDGEFSSTDTVVINVVRSGGLADVIIKLKDSNGIGIPGGVAWYHKDTWQDAGVTDSNGETHVHLLPGKYKFRMSWLGVSNIKYEEVTHNSSVIFQTVKTMVRLVDSMGTGSADGTAQYHLNTWHTIGITDALGNTALELLPAEYKFGMEYRGVPSYKIQNIALDPVVLFKTVSAQVRLVDSMGVGLPGGNSRSYKNIWQDIGTTNAAGNARIELLPGEYKFSMEYADNVVYKYQDITLDPVVIFQTIKANVKLRAGNGSGLPGGNARCFNRIWQIPGTTDAAGNAYIELLPGAYKFEMVFAGVSQYKDQDITINPEIIFNTLEVNIRLVDNNGNGIAGGHVQYLRTTWNDTGLTDAAGNVFINLFPAEYKFSMEYAGKVQYHYQDIGSEQLVLFTADY